MSTRMYRMDERRAAHVSNITFRTSHKSSSVYHQNLLGEVNPDTVRSAPSVCTSRASSNAFGGQMKVEPRLDVVHQVGSLAHHPVGPGGNGPPVGKPNGGP